jgi:hypothetical protein
MIGSLSFSTEFAMKSKSIPWMIYFPGQIFSAQLNEGKRISPQDAKP